VLVISDHGGGPVYKDVYLNNWLHEQGWLAYKRKAPVAAGFKGLLRRVGLTRDRGWRFLSPANLARIKRWLPFLVRWVPEPITTLAEVVDWERTQAYSFGYLGQIYINLQGREPQGIVPPGEAYARVVGEIKAALLDWEDPEDGRPIVDRVYQKSELYHGPHTERAPDLCLIMRDLSYITHTGREFEHGHTLGPPSETGTHRLDGLFLARGAGIRSAVQFGGASLADIMPTILYLLDVPIPADVDGHVMMEVLDPTLLSRRPIRYAEQGDVPPSEFLRDDWTEEDEKRMLEHLKNLGYLG
jgi:predicted AlkP superfamily phosphohydrolase/phosphomutase